jgi:DNA-binding MarR family transcriptional regulator
MPEIPAETLPEPAPVPENTVPENTVAENAGTEPADDQLSDFSEAFRLAKHAVGNASFSLFARHGVYEGQQFVLRRLWRQDGLTPGQIARQLGIATPTVTKAATRMEAAGLLRREPHPSDGRLVQLWLTPRGRELEQVIGPEMRAQAERTLAGFSRAERAALVQALHRIAGNLSAE